MPGAAGEDRASETVGTGRLPVRKTYKLWIGGAFVRSESGRSDLVGGVNIPRGSRKDVRDAMVAARRAQAGWAARTAYNRGQILYRAAEALESRRAQLADLLCEDGASSAHAQTELDAAIDVLVHYAGWTDKFQAVLGGVNPVAGPFLSFSVPEPTGVVGVVAPDRPALLGLVAELAPALAAGNTVVAVISQAAPQVGLDLAEALAVSDLPAGVVNLLSGRREELAIALGAHRDLNAIIDACADGELGAELDRLAAETIKRARHYPPADSYERAVENALERLAAVTELKTAWHPVGA
ncbi:MAG: aldehyde dehydrogenase family protein [Solirubrobacteraceae bacterium]